MTSNNVMRHRADHHYWPSSIDRRYVWTRPHRQAAFGEPGTGCIYVSGLDGWARTPPGQNWLSSRCANYRETSRVGSVEGIGSRRSDLYPIFPSSSLGVGTRWLKRLWSVLYSIGTDTRCGWSSLSRRCADSGWPAVWRHLSCHAGASSAAIACCPARWHQL